MLTIKKLKEMKPLTIFAKGEVVDSPEGCNMANTSKTIRWVAVRGHIHTWSIYCQNPHYIDSKDPLTVAVGYSGVWDWEKIKAVGDKIHCELNIKKLVECDKESFEMYNH